MRLTWLRFRREFASGWLSFQNESTAQYSCALVREAMMTLADDSGSPIVLLRSAADGGRATVYCAALAACLRGGERNRCLGVGRMPCATVLRTAHAVSAGRAHTRAVSPDLLQNKVLLR